MAFDGNGTFNRLYDWTDDAANAVNISSTKMDAEQDGIATALSAVLVKDGQAPMTGDLDMNGNDIILDIDADTKINMATDDVVALDIGGTSGVLVGRSAYMDGVGLARIMRGHVTGLVCSQDTDTAHDINVTAGATANTTGAAIMYLSSEITKQIDAVWALGDDAGGLDTGAVAASTLYGIWLIQRSDTLVVDVLISTAFTYAGLTRPTNYDRAQLIGACTTDLSANIIAFTQSANYFRHTGEAVLEVSDNSITSNIYEPRTMVGCPPLCLAHITGYLTNSTTGETQGILNIRTNGAGEVAGTESEAWSVSSHAGTFDKTEQLGWVMTDASGIIQYAAEEGAASAATIGIRCVGFLMLSRGNAA